MSADGGKGERGFGFTVSATQGAGVGFTAGAAGRGLHSTARGWGGAILVAAPCRWGATFDQWQLHGDDNDQLLERLLEGEGIESPGSMGTSWFTGRTTGSTGLIPMQPLSRLLD